MYRLRSNRRRKRIDLQMGNAVDNLHTNQSLLDALEKAARRKLTQREVNEQRLSFIIGAVKPSETLTKSRISEILKEQEGIAAE